MTNIMSKSPEYQYSSEDAGRRFYRNVLLSYLSTKIPTAETQDPQKAELAYTHYKNADNMNDKFAAMRCLRDLPSKSRDLAFDDFYEYTKGEN